MDNAVKVYENDTLRFSIYTDPDPISPIEDCDHEERMICFHKRYRLGDEHSYNMDDYTSWLGLKRAIMHDNKDAVVLPLYLYDHSGITMKTTPFGDRWDSGQVGFIYITKEGMKKYYGESMPRYWRKRANEILVSAVKCYDDYLTGNVYGFILEKKSKCESCTTIEYERIDSCWGFIGDYETSGILDNLPAELKDVKPHEAA